MTMIDYNSSPMPPEKPGGEAIQRNPDRGIAVDAKGNWAYASAAASGDTEVVLPALPGSPNREERLLTKDFGPTVAAKIEAALKRQPYLRSGPSQSPPDVLAHYIATARGAKLLDDGTLHDLERLCKEFSAEKGEHRGTYFATMVRPFLNGLTPKRRKQ